MKLFPLFTYMQAIGNLLPTPFSKYPCELKQNGTQENTQFSETVSYPLSHGIFLRVLALKTIEWTISIDCQRILTRQ